MLLRMSQNQGGILVPLWEHLKLKETKKRDNVRQGKIASLLPPTHMERRRERKGMTGIRCWVDGHSDGISDDRVVRYFAFASVFEILVCFSFVLQASETG